MVWRIALALSTLLLVVGPFWSDKHAASAETCPELRQSKLLRFDRPQQKHPKTVTLATLITVPTESEIGRPLSFYGSYTTIFGMNALNPGEDPRNGKGQVILTVEVVRDDEIIWKKKKKDRIKYDRHTDFYCGNCTHKLNFRNKKGFEGSLQVGDLVLWHFKFKKMPRFEAGEAAHLGGEIQGFY